MNNSSNSHNSKTAAAAKYTLHFFQMFLTLSQTLDVTDTIADNSFVHRDHEQEEENVGALLRLRRQETDGYIAFTYHFQIEMNTKGLQFLPSVYVFALL